VFKVRHFGKNVISITVVFSGTFGGKTISDCSVYLKATLCIILHRMMYNIAFFKIYFKKH